MTPKYKHVVSSPWQTRKPLPAGCGKTPSPPERRPTNGEATGSYEVRCVSVSFHFEFQGPSKASVLGII